MFPKLCLFALSLGAVLFAAVPSLAASPAPAEAQEGLGLSLSIDSNTYAVPAAAAGAMPAAAPHLHAVMVFFNYSHAPLRLQIHGAAAQWQIVDAHNVVVWDYSVGRAIPHSIRIVPLQNGHLRYAQDIPLCTQSGAPLAPGRYTLRASLPDALGATASLDFTVTQ